MSTIEVTQNETERIATLLSAADVDAAEELLRIAETTTSKDNRKAARRALYLLSQKHITPSAPISRSAPVPVSHFRKEPTPFVAYVSSLDGDGNASVSIAVTDPDSGSPMLYQVLVNDEVGIKDYVIERIPRRKLQDYGEMLLARLEDGIAIAEVEVDYAIRLVHDTREINHKLGTQSPSGFLDVLEAIGEPKREDAVSAAHEALYTIYAKDELISDISFSATPEEFFALPWFDSWFLLAEVMVPWLEAMDEGKFGDTSDEVERSACLQRMIHTATSIVMDQGLCDRYVHRLEASAFVLHRRGKTMAARFALYHALQLRAQGAKSDFATLVIERTTLAAIEMTAMREQGLDPEVLDILLDPAVMSEFTPQVRRIFQVGSLEADDDPDVIGVIHPTATATEPR